MDGGDTIQYHYIGRSACWNVGSRTGKRLPVRATLPHFPAQRRRLNLNLSQFLPGF